MSASKIKQLQGQVQQLSEQHTHLLDAVPYNWGPGAAKDTHELRLGSNLAGGVRHKANGLYEARCRLPGSTLAFDDLASLAEAKDALERTAAQWLKQLLG